MSHDDDNSSIDTQTTQILEYDEDSDGVDTSRESMELEGTKLAKMVCTACVDEMTYFGAQLPPEDHEPGCPRGFPAEDEEDCDGAQGDKKRRKL